VGAVGSSCRGTNYVYATNYITVTLVPMGVQQLHGQGGYGVPFAGRTRWPYFTKPLADYYAPDLMKTSASPSQYAVPGGARGPDASLHRGRDDGVGVHFCLHGHRVIYAMLFGMRYDHWSAASGGERESR